MPCAKYLPCVLLSFAIVPALLGQGAKPSSNPASDTLRRYYDGTKDMLLRAAEKMPEELYGFRPVADVRSFGEIVAHAAQANFNLCSIVKGEPNPTAGQGLFEKTKTTKAEIIAALKSSYAYCDGPIAALRDSELGEARTMFGSPANKATPVTQAFTHMNKHYGNLITYMRMKGIVPPSSE